MAAKEEDELLDINLRAGPASAYHGCHAGPCFSAPPFPEELRNVTCGIRTRRGTFCQRRELYQSWRCRLLGVRAWDQRLNGEREIGSEWTATEATLTC